MHSPRNRAVSLIEIILATVVLAVVSVAVLQFATMPGDRVKKQTCDAIIAELELLTEQYQTDTGALPSSNLAPLSGDRYLGHQLPTCPVDGRAYALDRRTAAVVPHAHP